METTQISQKDIERCINGRDPMERIVDLSYSNEDDFVTIIYRNERDQKCKTKESFYPFCWATLAACQKLCDGNRSELKELMARYRIGVKKLSNTSITGEVRHEFDDGYLFMFYAKVPMSYTRFLAFFKSARNPIYSNRRDDNTVQRPVSESRQYLIVPPKEQFMIHTGKRYFKGYDDYDQLLKLSFDLESTGLNTKKDRITHIGMRTNRPFLNHPNGLEISLSIKGETEEEKDAWEVWAIDQMFRVIYTVKPDIITAHNGENFDWNLIIDACTRLGSSIEAMSQRYFGGESIHKEERETILKLGGEIETFHRTVVPGSIVTDSLHAVRRAQALDSNMLKADLKYVSKYSKIVKPNRVYIPGDKINKTLNDTEHDYAFNDTDGKWYIIDEAHPLKEGYEIKTGAYIVERYLLDDIYECDRVEYRYNTSNFLVCKMLPVPYGKCITMGTAGQWKSLMMAWSYEHNLAIPMFRESKTFTGGLSRLLRVGYVKKVVKLDYNSLYPSIILTWGITDPIDLMQVMLYFLEYVLTQREKYKGLKKKAGKKKDAAKEEIEAYEGDEMGLLALRKEMMKYASDEAFNDKKQLPLKIFGNSFFGSYGAPNVFPWGSIKCAEQTTCTGRQCLRLMISHFKNLGYEPIVGDTDGFNFALPDDSVYRYTKEHPYISTGLSRETEAGKSYTGFKADVAEFNDMYMSDKHYAPNAVNKMGLGIDEVVESTINFSRKNYADYFPENPYPEDVKMVGNTIKSKKMPEYIAKFLAVGIRLLLKGEGQNFLNEYYSYIEKIYNYQIPLRDIASKGKIKKSLEEYKRDVMEITKAGRPKSRQAWYELALKYNLKVDNGDTIYYVNTGKTKSHADVKKIKKFFIINEDKKKEEITKTIEKEYKTWKNSDESIKSVGGSNLASTYTITEFARMKYNAFAEDEIIFNSELVPREIIEREEDTFCSEVGENLEYNVAKYIDMFNKRIKPLLVCFSTEIREQIMITNPDERPYFTEEQCKLTSGEPNKPTDQDTYEQLMQITDREINFWKTYNLVPPFIEECGMGKWEDILADYDKRMQEEAENGIAEEKATYHEILSTLTSEELDTFMEEGEMPAVLLKIVDVDTESSNLVSKKYKGAIIGDISDLVEAWNRAEDDSDKNID